MSNTQYLSVTITKIVNGSKSIAIAYAYVPLNANWIVYVHIYSVFVSWNEWGNLYSQIILPFICCYMYHYCIMGIKKLITHHSASIIFQLRSALCLETIKRIFYQLIVSPTNFCDVIMDTTASQITSLTIVYLTVYSVADQRKHQSSASLAFVRGTPHKGPVTWKMFPFYDVIVWHCSSHHMIAPMLIN